MGAKFRSILIGAIILVVAIALIIVEIRVYGTGFAGKTLWDWLQLLIIPMVLAVAALLFNFATTRTEQKIAAQRYEQDQQIAERRYEQDQKLALDKQREDLFHVYLDRMSELLLDKQLRTSEPNTEVRNVARVRTITILFQLDARRIGYVFALLRESGLMSNKPHSSIVHFQKADLKNINFSHADLRDADLSRANLRDADLSYADPMCTNLSNAILSNANLSNTFIISTNLSNAILRRADLSDAYLNGADISEAD